MKLIDQLLQVEENIFSMSLDQVEKLVEAIENKMEVSDGVTRTRWSRYLGRARIVKLDRWRV